MRLPIDKKVVKISYHFDNSVYYTDEKNTDNFQDNLKMSVGQNNKYKPVDWSKEEEEVTDSSDIFLIEKGWIDPMENRNAMGYNPYAFVYNEKEAKDFCESNGFWTREDCWEISSKKDGKMMKYRYVSIPRL